MTVSVHLGHTRNRTANGSATTVSFDDELLESQSDDNNRYAQWNVKLQASKTAPRRDKLLSILGHITAFHIKKFLHLWQFRLFISRMLVLRNKNFADNRDQNSFFIYTFYKISIKLFKKIFYTQLCHFEK